MSTLLEALEPYRNNQMQVVSLYSNGGRIDNQHLMNAHALALCFRIDQHDLNLVDFMLKVEAFVTECMKPDDLLRRWPGSMGTMSWDEVIGALVCCWYTGDIETARKIYDYGQAKLWFFNPPAPGTPSGQSFLARNGQLIPLAKMVAKLPLTWLDRFFWCLGLMLSFFTFESKTKDQFWALAKTGFLKRNDTSGKLLCDVQTPVMNYESKTAIIVIRIWELGMRIMYPGGRRQIYGVYMPAHPIATNQPDNWD